MAFSDADVNRKVHILNKILTNVSSEFIPHKTTVFNKNKLLLDHLQKKTYDSKKEYCL